MGIPCNGSGNGIEDLYKGVGGRGEKQEIHSCKMEVRDHLVIQVR